MKKEDIERLEEGKELLTEIDSLKVLVERLKEQTKTELTLITNNPYISSEIQQNSYSPEPWMIDGIIEATTNRIEKLQNKFNKL